MSTTSESDAQAKPTAGKDEPFPDRRGQTLTGAEILFEALLREGVEVIFGYPGGAILPTYDAMTRYPIRHVLTRHEQGASHMADGYARACGRVGVCLATSGPGATNLVTGLATAMLDSSPIVAITGQVPSRVLGSDAFQEVDITGVTLPVTKHNYLVTRADEVAAAVREAFYVARSGRPGPVLIDFCKDAQQGTAVFEWPDETPTLPGYRPTHEPEPDGLTHALRLIDSAKRPLVLSGQGVIKSGATEALTKFVEQCDVPVTCTLLGLGGFPASHPRSLGMMGMHGESWVNTAIQEADLLIAVGMRFDDRVTGNVETYAPVAKKIHIELDPAEINKIVKVDVALIGDARETLETLNEGIKPQKRADWIARLDELKGDSAVRDIQTLPDSGKLFAAHVIHDLWRFTSGDALVVTDVGQHQMWEAQYYRHDKPRTLITSGGLGTMGFAVPAAIGARFGREDAEIWVIVGDGGFQMTNMELSTAAQEGLSFNIAIINNGFLGMVRQWQEFFYDKRYQATPLHNPNFVMLAEAHGLHAQRVDSRAGVEAAVRAAQAHDGVSVIDFVVEQEDTVYPMVPTGANLDAMIRRPHPAAPTLGHNPIFETGSDQ